MGVFRVFVLLCLVCIVHAENRSFWTLEEYQHSRVASSPVISPSFPGVSFVAFSSRQVPSHGEMELVAFDSKNGHIISTQSFPGVPSFHHYPYNFSVVNGLAFLNDLLFVTFSVDMGYAHGLGSFEVASNFSLSPYGFLDMSIYSPCMGNMDFISAPIVGGDKLYVSLSCNGGQYQVLLCFGRFQTPMFMLLWRFVMPNANNDGYLPNPPPAVSRNAVVWVEQRSQQLRPDSVWVFDPAVGSRICNFSFPTVGQITTLAIDSSNGIVFASYFENFENTRVGAASSTSGKILWTLSVPGFILDFHAAQDSLFFSMVSTNTGNIELYRLDAKNGLIQWHTVLNQQENAAFTVFERFIIVAGFPENVTAISSVDGSKLWSVSNNLTFVRSGPPLSIGYEVNHVSYNINFFFVKELVFQVPQASVCGTNETILVSWNFVTSAPDYVQNRLIGFQRNK